MEFHARYLFRTTILIAFANVTALAQPMSFEVATIRPTQGSTGIRMGMSVDGARVTCTAISLTDLIESAYHVKPGQVAGPDWLSSQRFDINAKIPDKVPPSRVPEMIRSMLVERFGLAAHQETRDHPTYALVVGKNGPKLQPAAAGEAGNRMTKVNGHMEMQLSRITMAAFAELLTRVEDRPVVDMTGLGGEYHITFEISPEELQNILRADGIPPSAAGADPRPAESIADPSGASVFTALQSLGLKLESRKSPVETIVVDHVEKTPTEN